METTPIAAQNSPVSSRLERIVDALELDGTEDVLEVGFGHGVAATLVLERLTSGSYTGVDRSAKMVAAAERRNREAVDTGRACFIRASFAAVELPAASFDRIFAARVRAMFEPAEQAVAERLVRPSGRLFLPTEPPPARRPAATKRGRAPGRGRGRAG